MSFNLTAPGPLWAMARGAPGQRYADHWMPSARAFGQFVRAVGQRYSGHYSFAPGAEPIPRVSIWSIWNEPNQPGWLAPQWRDVGGAPVIEAAALYRSYVAAAWRGLAETGHTPGRDTILVGELAPEGAARPPLGFRTATPPLSFLRALYCVDASYRPLRGAAAAALSCPAAGSGPAFVAANPALFDATGFAHHPYSFFLAPNVSLPDPDFAPISDLDRLERALDASLAAYGVKRKLPLWLTEYGYETDPPDPFRGVSPRLQSLYLNEAQYMAFRDPRVRAMAQFLLYDARPDPHYPPGTPQYWSTFQTGLLYADGSPKPSFTSYRLPLFIPDPVLGAGNRVLVWALLRAAPPGTRQPVLVEWRTQQSADLPPDRPHHGEAARRGFDRSGGATRTRRGEDLLDFAQRCRRVQPRRRRDPLARRDRWARERLARPGARSPPAWARRTRPPCIEHRLAAAAQAVAGLGEGMTDRGGPPGIPAAPPKHSAQGRGQTGGQRDRAKQHDRPGHRALGRAGHRGRERFRAARHRPPSAAGSSPVPAASNRRWPAR